MNTAAHEAGRAHASTAVDAMLAALATGLAKSSYPSSQSEDLLAEVARAYDHPIELTVLSTVSLIGDPTTGNLRLQRIGGSYRFDQIAAVEDQLTRARAAAAPPEEITAELKRIDSARAPLPVWLRVAGYGLATVGFAAALRLDPNLFLVALGLGLLVGVALALVNPNSRGGALMPVAATFGVALIVGILSDAAGLDDPVRLAAVPVLFLLPGATITSAVIELVNGDMLAGSSRLVFAIMQLVAMAFAFVLAIDLAGVSPQDLRDLSPTEGPAWLAWLGAGAFAAGLAIYGCTPRRLWVKILVLAFFAFTVQQLASEWLAGPLAGGVAAALALLGAYILDGVGEARGRQRTQSGPAALVLFIPAFWLIVPGSLGFTALAGALAANQSLSALGPQAAFTFLTMAIGIMLASLVWTRWTDPGTG